MVDPQSPQANRREFLIGTALRAEVGEAGQVLADSVIEAAGEVPAASSTIRLAARAMACEFSVVMNPGPTAQVRRASDTLDLLPALESMMTVYRDDSELARVNSEAAVDDSVVSEELFGLLLRATDIAVATQGAFDPTTGPLVELWRSCRAQDAIPTQAQIAGCLQYCGAHHVELLAEDRTIRFDDERVRMNLGGIGKGYALDQLGQFLHTQGQTEFLLCGGHSSLLGVGGHNQAAGWPIGLRNPLFPRQRFATLLVQNRAMSTSGSNVQYFRHGGRRYGHILDPRTGWPAERLLSCTVLAPTAELADALSTAFFVLGVEKARAYCDNHPEVGALLIPQPLRGRQLQPLIVGIPDEALFITSEDVLPER